MPSTTSERPNHAHPTPNRAHNTAPKEPKSREKETRPHIDPRTKGSRPQVGRCAIARGSNGEEDGSHGQNEQTEPEGGVSGRRHDKDVVDPEPIQADVASDDQDEPYNGHEEPQFLQQAGTL